MIKNPFKIQRFLTKVRRKINQRLLQK